jgi:hypothetical protein
VPHYNRPITEPAPDEQEEAAALDNAMDTAAEALRQAEIESAQESAAVRESGQDEPAMPRKAK